MQKEGSGSTVPLQAHLPSKPCPCLSLSPISKHCQSNMPLRPKRFISSPREQDNNWNPRSAIRPLPLPSMARTHRPPRLRLRRPLARPNSRAGFRISRLVDPTYRNVEDAEEEEEGSDLAVGGDLDRSEERPSQRHLRLRLRLACSAQVDGACRSGRIGGDRGGEGTDTERAAAAWRGRAPGQKGMRGPRPAHARSRREATPRYWAWAE